MKKRILRYLKHVLLTIFIVVPIVIYIGHLNGAALKYNGNPLVMNWDNDGPYIFYDNDSTLSLNFIKGNKDSGYYIEQKHYPVDSLSSATCYNPLDSTKFNFQIKTDFTTPDITYHDKNKILAISDIEGNYITFRDFLINSNVIDRNLNWTFEKGHLVLVGDFVDRGYFSTQVLWLIYKLELEAEKQGGYFHYILGNHELKTMQGNYMSASPKYYHVASILGKQQYELYNTNSLIGKWLASKNALELINGNLFVHGGIHPDLADSNLSLEELNHIIRMNYGKPFYPRKERDLEQFIVSSETGPCWYRGYFKDDLTQSQVDKGLDKFNAKRVIVGHTIQGKVNRQYDGKVIGIDVQHPSDQYKYWPGRRSEALLVEGGKFFRVFDNGDKEEI